MHNKGFTKMVKPYRHQLKDAKTIKSYENLSDLNQYPHNENHKCHSNLCFLKDEMEVRDKSKSAKRQKFNKVTISFPF